MTAEKKTFKVIIAGGRNFFNYKDLHDYCKFVLQDKFDFQIEIVSGGATGADALGEKFAQHMGFNVKRFLADWSKHGKAGGPIRNKKNVRIC